MNLMRYCQKFIFVSFIKLHFIGLWRKINFKLLSCF